ncbi:MAG TPA: hypothetical protein VGF87_09510 [Acidimicrobiales bacterium]|jgi:hypothetical protein
MDAPQARTIERPEPMQALDTFETPDYTDAYEISIVAVEQRTAEQWVRAIFEDAPRWLVRFMMFGWRFGLLIRLTPAPEKVLGWDIVDATDKWIVLESRSPFLATHLITAVGDTTVIQSTSVRYDRRGAAVGWRPTVLLHRRILPYLVRHAVAQAPPR